jgi:hypothetical protein
MDILELILEILSGLIIAIPLVIKLVEYVKKSAMEKNWNNLIRLVMNLMATAEEKFDNGADRKEWVIAMVRASADTINYPINEKELGDLINENVDAVEALNRVAAGKADKEHEHPEYKLNIENGTGEGSIVMKNGDDPAIHYINESEGNGNLVTGDRNKAFGVKCLVTGTANDTHGNSNTVTGQSHKTTNKTSGLLVGGNSNRIYNSIYSLYSGQDNADALEADGSDVVDFASTANNQSVIVLGKKNRVRK